MRFLHWSRQSRRSKRKQTSNHTQWSSLVSTAGTMSATIQKAMFSFLGCYLCEHSQTLNLYEHITWTQSFCGQIIHFGHKISWHVLNFTDTRKLNHTIVAVVVVGIEHSAGNKSSGRKYKKVEESINNINNNDHRNEINLWPRWNEMRWDEVRKPQNDGLSTLMVYWNQSWIQRNTTNVLPMLALAMDDVFSI